jgi:RNA polymerase sigma-70 factor (ECF subfamily)
VAAFDALARRHRARLMGMLYHLTGNREDAADLCQDALIRAFCHIRSFGGRSQFYTWLYRIAVNLALEQMRRGRLRRFCSLERLAAAAESDGAVLALASRLKTDRALLMKELQQQINGALQALPPKQRAVVVLAEVEGLPAGEIGQILGCSEGTVRSRLHYARERLKELLHHYLEG